MKRTAILFTLFLLLVASLSSQALIEANRSLVIPLLAVVSKNQGAVIKAKLWISTPGKGLFVVQPPFGVAQDTALSARLALYYASLLAHIDLSTLNAGISFINEREVSGASAGLPLALGYYALLTGRGFNTTRVAGTGLLSPNGLILNVGGIEEKVKAGLKAGIKVFLIPFSDYVKYSSMLRALNVTVYPVCSIADTMVYTFKIPRVYINNSVSESYFKRAAAQLINLLNKTFRSICGAGECPAVTVSIVQDSLEKATFLFEKKYYYTSASVAYSGFISLLSSLNASEAEKAAKLILSSVDKKKLAEEMYALKTGLLEHKLIPLWRLEALISADYRLYASAKLLVSSNPKYRAIGALRLLTSLQWLEVAERVEGPLISKSAFIRAAKLLVDYADIAFKYMAALTKGRGIEIRNAEMIPLSQLASDMQVALFQNDYIRAVALALNILGVITGSLASYDINSGTPPAKLLECALHELRLHEAVTGLRSFNAEILADYALHTPYNESKALIADRAATYSLLLLSLSVNSVASGVENIQSIDPLVVLVGAALLGSIASALSVVLLSRGEVE